MSNEELIDEINTLKKQKNAVILAHYYEMDPIQAIADFTGDSLALAVAASKTDAAIIVFCGVRFMAETAKIISPQKKVLLPAADAGCPLADFATKDAVLRKKKELGDVAVVSYVNTTAEVKAVSDICCTSANAVSVVKAIPQNRILFVPDKNLGEYVKKNVPDKEIFLWNGYCYVHTAIKKKDILKIKEKYPDAKLAAHPECSKEIRDIADAIGSTTGVINFATQTNIKRIIIGTEQGVTYPIKKKVPEKELFILKEAICEDMKKTDMLKLRDALLYERYEIKLSAYILENARQPIQRMLELKV
ncbi:MAG: quinolinate synthase NadA [Deltaproteobacteria bacterium]|nr:quinolinate synthase NadA [Deltaproteobacteria bacterium]